ncbi:alpha/beta fold hydrolase [Leucobacter luti]|uniref:alpha/beta fold hydrolase n=1 Tax=Leucobacter luti TaxID=340320 RepID=UPI001C68FEDB|nr:alpha/beta hydrolase [Leucobacter luti]QYM76329.1 alpha/beta hydrolase [Leucobacter luti]
MRKPLKITLTVIGIIVALPIALLSTTAIVNAVATKAELEAITPYGTLIPVAGKQMNVVDTGVREGDATDSETIVLLPGLGTAAPALDFAPLISELEDTHRVIAIEPFGTGLSDQTDVPRTAENITRELHEALQQLGIERYVLMGHSIAGIYALEYSRVFPDELIAFVGIDSSVPDQPGWDEPVPTSGLAELRDLGILRALTALSGDANTALPHDEKTKEQMRLLTTKNSVESTLLDEVTRSSENFANVSGESFPADLPLLLFVADDASGDDVAGWLELHERQAASVAHGQVVSLAGEHYLHYTQSVRIASETAEFLAALATR